MAIEIIRREEARAKGLKRFFTGVPCKRSGHIAESYVSTAWCVECHRIDFKKWYDAHPDHFANKARRQRDADPEGYKARYDRWVAENYDRKLTQNRNYRGRRAGAIGEHTPEESAALLELQRWICANPYCQVDLRSVEKALDHIVALVHGGSNGIENLQWLCDPCNKRKSHLSVDEWLRREAERAQSV